MKWTEIAIQDLKRYDGLKRSVQAINERIELLEMQKCLISSTDTERIMVQSTPANIDDRLIDNIVQRERLMMNLEINQKLIGLIERGLSALNDTEKRVLDLFYISRRKNHIDTLMTELCYEQAMIYKIKDQALYNFTVNMFGIPEY